MRKLTILGLVFMALFALAACTTRPTAVNPDLGVPLAEATEAVQEPAQGEEVASTAAADEGEAGMAADDSADTAPEDAADVPASAQEADVSYTLVTGMGDAGMAFIGQGGDIEGVANPTLTAQVGDTVSITLVNGDGVLHDLTIDEFGVMTEQFATQDQEETVTFTVDEAGEFNYYCSVPGHRQAGMEGLFVVEGESGGAQASADEEGGDAVQGSPVDPEEAADAGYVGAAEAAAPAAPAAEASAQAQSIVLNPADVPEAVGARGPETVTVDLTAQELDGLLADGTTYTYWTFNGTVPGPFIRVREGDTVELTLTNEDGSQFPHSIDLHAVNGPGGGEVFTQTAPGDTTSFTFQALNPGLYVYHCATPSVAHHITNGMYGLILVEPAGGLPPVDREFYVMQGELYTVQPYGEQGHVAFDYDKMLSEEPEYFVFNGAAGALTQDENALYAEVGDTVRIFFGVGGPNFTSSFHVIGEIFDRAYPFASLTASPLTDVQTVTVPPGGATMVEFTVEVPGRYILVDHALSRVERGLAGFLYAEGEDNPEIFREGTGEQP